MRACASGECASGKCTSTASKSVWVEARLLRRRLSILDGRSRCVGAPGGGALVVVWRGTVVRLELLELLVHLLQILSQSSNSSEIY